MVKQRHSVEHRDPPPIVGLRLGAFIAEKAKYWRDGVNAPEDYRYLAMYEYLRLSPSFVAVLRAIEGKRSPFPVPKDLERVRPIVEDFRQVMRTEPVDWWRKHGKHLFGVTAPAPMVFMAGRLTGKAKSLLVMWDKTDAIVLRVGVNQNKKDALKDFEKILDGLLARGQFGDAAKQEQKPKYTFLKTRLRESSLAIGTQILGSYQSSRGFPLWWIGNLYDVSPAHAITAEDLVKLEPAEIAYRKKILGIATSRIVKYAMLVAENAARGRFPCSDPFAEAQLDLFQRTVGKPVGRKAKSGLEHDMTTTSPRTGWLPNGYSN